MLAFKDFSQSQAPHAALLAIMFVLGTAEVRAQSYSEADAATVTGASAIKEISLNPSPAKAAAPQARGQPLQQPLNGYAETLKPTPRHKLAANAKPYAPIKPPDDKYNILEVDMFVGESRVFPAPNIGRIAVGNGAIMSAAALDEKEVIVFANSPGTSSLFIWNKDGRYQRIKINIVAGDTTRVQREVAAFLSQMPNAKASVVGDKVIVEGDNLSDTDRHRIAEIAKNYPQVVNFTDPTGWEKMIMMDVKVVEFPKSVMNEIGLKWGNPAGVIQAGALWYPLQRGGGAVLATPDAQWTGANGPLILPKNMVSAFGMNLALNAQINLLAQTGDAAVLAEPILSTRNGSPATFLAGGEIPYQGASSTGTPFIQFKKYGVELEIKPVADRTGAIRADIKTKVSAIDPSIATASGPALRTRETTTTFNVKSGQTIVLSGFLSREQSEDIDKLPGLGDLPVLGALFRSKKFINKETELVVFVTPSIVSEQSPGMSDRLAKTEQRLEQQFGSQPYLTQPLQPGADMGHPNQVPRPNGGTDEHNPNDKAADARSRLSEYPVELNVIPPWEKIAELPSFTANKAPAAAYVNFRVSKDGLAMRLSPDVNAPLLLHLPENAIVERLPQASQNGWVPVQVGATRGWVLGQWLELVRS
ncbi:MAG TPA: pilus assembly protein N-terminal domain-containing protein [Noviherbaspirillum sp.]|nr:pilus assembly protein N-terminal domain-containing protein [Noviherbaspirillum sp.]